MIVGFRRYCRSAVAIFFACLANAANICASPVIPGSPQEKPIAIQNATIHPVSSPAIENGMLLFEDGKIVAVGTKLELPDDVQIVDGNGLHVYPGFINAGGQLGLVEIDAVRASVDDAETGELNSNVKAQVVFNPDSELIPVTRSNGVLVSLSVPTGRLIAGQSALMQLDGWTWEDMTVASPVGLHIYWPSLRPSRNWWAAKGSDANEPDRQLKTLRDFFQKAQRYCESVPVDAEVTDVRLDAMRVVFDQSVPLVVHADSVGEIRSAVAFCVEFKVRMILHGGMDAAVCAKLLKDRDVPVIVGSVHRLPSVRSDAFDSAYSLPSRLEQAGVRYCIAGVGRFGASNLRNLPYHAGTAVAYGTDLDEAIRAVTLYPAEILGVSDRLGSLEEGKDATLFLCNGNPLDTNSSVEMAYVQGKKLSLISRHTELFRKYQAKYDQIETLKQDKQ